jgi:hypothetical protein
MRQLQILSAPTREGWDVEVEIDPNTDHASRHNVRVNREDVERWGAGSGPEELVRRSFEFLLEREEPGQILKSFELSDIKRYFPDYPEAMAG